MTLKLQHAPPPPVTFDPEVMDMTFGPQYDHVELLIYLDPTCHYQLRVKASFREMLGQVGGILSSSEPKLIVYRLSQCLSIRPSTLSNMNISATSGLIMSPPKGLGDILFFPGRPSLCPSVCLSVCHESCPLCNLKTP